MKGALRAHVVAARATRSARKTPGRVPVQVLPARIASSYQAALTAMLQPAIRRAFAPLVAALPAILRSAAHERADAGEGKRIRELVERAARDIGAALSLTEMEKLAERFARQTGAHNRVQLNRQVRSAFGVDVVAADRFLPPMIENFVAENVALIRNIAPDTAAKVETLVTRAVNDGKLHGTLAKELEATIGYPTRRAALIARDQVGKLYGNINAARQQEMGVTRFKWRSVHDQRVRKSHQHFDGNVYEYANPPEERGERVLPGQPVLCRCNAEPMLDDLI